MRKSGSAPIASQTGSGGLLNYSQLAEWNRCRYRYNLSTLRHINSRAVIRALDLGSACHVGMAAAVRHFTRPREGKINRPARYRHTVKHAHDAVLEWAAEQVVLRGGKEQMTEEELHDLDEILVCGPQIVKRALEHLNLSKWHTITLLRLPVIELGIQIKFPGWQGFHGTPDWVAEDVEEGGTWLIDYKFRESFTPPEAEEVNLQMAIYQHLLLARHKIETTGTIMFQGRSRIPAQPSLNKNGTMSRVRIATNWETYKGALRSAGLKPADYEEEMRPKLDFEFFRMDRMFRGPDEVEALWQQVVVPNGGVMLRDMQNPSTMYRNMSFMNCNGCWARDFCLTELRDEDTDFLLKTRYIDLNNPQARLVLRPEDLIMED